eukprot:4035049-Prymnesium_polylepis.1
MGQQRCKRTLRARRASRRAGRAARVSCGRGARCAHMSSRALRVLCHQADKLVHGQLRVHLLAYRLEHVDHLLLRHPGPHRVEKLADLLLLDRAGRVNVERVEPGGELGCLALLLQVGAHVHAHAPVVQPVLDVRPPQLPHGDGRRLLGGSRRPQRWQRRAVLLGVRNVGHEQLRPVLVGKELRVQQPLHRARRRRLTSCCFRARQKTSKSVSRVFPMAYYRSGRWPMLSPKA